MRKVRSIVTAVCFGAIVGCLLVASGGCRSSTSPATPGVVAATQPTLSADVTTIDADFRFAVSAARAIVSAQPDGPRKTKILAILDQATTYEQIGAAVAQVGASVVDPPATTPPKGSTP